MINTDHKLFTVMSRSQYFSHAKLKENEKLGFLLAVAGLVKQIIQRRSGGRMEESEGKDVFTCPLSHKRRPFPLGLVC